MLSVKVTGLLIVIVSSTMFGFLYAETYKNRILQLKEISNLIIIIETEIRFYKRTLPVIFDVQSNTVPFMKSVFENILVKISVGSDMESLWNEEVEKLHFCTYLNEKDIEFLKKTGHVLVRADAQNVEKMFLGLYRELDLIIENAIEEEKEKGRLFKSLGILFGLFISVVFA
jgi:stage III sporulation protein AB